MKVSLRNGAVVVPTIKGQFRDFVRLVHDDFLQSILDEDHVYLTTSKRQVNADKK